MLANAAPGERAAFRAGEMRGECSYGRTAGRYYALSAPDRDRLIVDLRRQGWTHARIGRRVGKNESGVRRHLKRMSAGGFGEGMTRG